MNQIKIAATFGCVAATLLLTGLSSAHIRMDAPISRNPVPEMEDSTNLKVGPCGGGGVRTTDPDRINEFAPGQTIEVAFRETIPHASHYRISFDDDGQDDFADPTSDTDIVDPPVLPVLLDGIPDPAPGADEFSIMVTLPDIECDNCTLQLIQYMYDREQPMYYQCADLVLSGDSVQPGTGGADGGTGGADGTGGETDSGGADAGTGGALGETGGALGETGGAEMGTGGAEATGGGVAMTGGADGTGGDVNSGTGATMGAATGGVAMSTGGALTDPDPLATGGDMPVDPGMTDPTYGDPGEEGGCSIRPSRAAQSGSSFLWATLLGAAFVWSRRRRSL